ncbi:MULTISPECIES: ABC transporter ATP-binding protein [unclassified Undibacterium]|uniref:ABC transporter ATP-binding protein n=1 Tax=unclassified Undibacterium TaxID=2630295 RepID=UPI002AC9AC52|nr:MULTISPECIES: ABC transporter ATP-binding protein [unclassified Undibacterium]MEB0140643.1 ABC transporter ATP-binding protein [Undibacterium sp. CCC2.1]MEB0173672.1 ABC transporter ATP-binding protein [Undibacterium sp. CCC1.1]MEB0177656.1 ABC transporter ATP-binding protein [Undibacterium sp. CCC3.4]MEB0216827.1 ABC transporter ATP-binding protein [Undibacterium sp. 5I2]WPX41928.1 ABC transporter ATP-binding protein [Undibacterium sp. CCC3.4]
MKNIAIEMNHVSRKFISPAGKVTLALRDFSLTVHEGDFCAIVGPTGCGKSTTLGMITGLNPPSSGTVKVFGKPVQGIDPNIGFVFQADAVFPWKNVIDNVAIGPIFRGIDAKLAHEMAAEWVRRVGLSGFEYHYPHQLSGGMRKRVALAQTFINEPKILLMDEPFSALDVQTRALMQDELLGLWSEKKASVVFVTHDIEEAIALADRVVVLSKGPGSVKSSYEIPLARPRDVSEARYTKEFIDLSKQIWTDLKDEVQI